MAKKHGVDGNKNRQKFKTPEARQAVFHLYCSHLAKGYSPKTFSACVENTVLKMLKDYPHEFDLEDLARAKAEGLFIWDKMGMLGTLGKIKGFRASTWAFIVRNKGLRPDKPPVKVIFVPSSKNCNQ